jgi:ribosomal protein S11
MDSFPKGNHLVMCYPGGTSRRFNIESNYAAMIAAGRVAEDAISKAVVNASEMRPHNRPITEKQKKAWENLAKAFGDERYYIEIPSAREIAEAGVKAMMVEADTLMEHESVRKAYDHFQLMCKLVNESKTQSVK